MTVTVYPPDYLVPKPYLQINPTTAELGTGYASLALFAVYLVTFAVLAIIEVTRTEDAKRSKRYSLPFLISVVGFCLLRVIQIAVALNVTLLYVNMATELVLYCLGCILFLLAFTFIAMAWTSILEKAEVKPALMINLKRGLLIMWALVSLGLMCVLVWFEASLPMNFGVSAHDGSVTLNDGALVIIVGPVNDTLVKPQTGILMASDNVHFSYMAERGLYACYGFVLGFAYTVLGLVLAVSVIRTQGAVRRGALNTVRSTVFRILIIAFPVALCFAVIFIFTVLEIATHRHGQRYEYYITSYLSSECVALGFMLFHFISAGMKSATRTKPSLPVSGWSNLKHTRDMTDLYSAATNTTAASQSTAAPATTVDGFGAGLDTLVI